MTHRNDITQFDTNKTKLYKEANKLNIPIMYLYTTDNINYKNIIDVIYELINKEKNVDFNVIYNLFALDKFHIHELICCYIDVKLKFDEDALNEDDEENEEENKLAHDINTSIIYINDDFPNIKVFYLSLRDLNEMYQTWKTNYQNMLERDMHQYEQIIENQEKLSKLEPVKYKNLKLEGFRIRFKPKINGKNLNIDDGPEIFAQAKTNIYIPFIQYVNEIGESVFWVLNDINLSTGNFYQRVVSKKRNCIFFIMWLSDSTPDYTKKYKKCTLDLNKNRLIIHDQNDDIISKTQEILKNTFRILEFNNYNKFYYHGLFEIPNFSIIIHVMQYLIINNSLFSTFFYINEGGKQTFVQKSKLIINFNSDEGIDKDNEDGDDEDDENNDNENTSVSFDFNSKYTVSSDVKINEKNNTNSTIVTIKRANSPEILDRCLIIFSRLLRLYLNEQNKVNKIFETLIPDLNTIKVNPGTTNKANKLVKVTTKPLSRIKALLKQFPELDKGTTPYCKFCQSNKQPIIIQEADISAWENKKIDGKKRIVKLYPPEGDHNYESVYLTCPHDNMPHLYYDKNTSNDTILRRPCCGIKRHTNEYYENFFGEDKKILSPAKTPSRHIVTNKIANEGGRGEVDNLIINLLKNDIDDNNYYRIGIPKSKSSFLHAIYKAINNKEYSKSNDKEKFIIEKRELITNEIDLNVCKQELYNLTLEEIENDFKNPEVLLDPSLFYRAIEEYFNINIIVLGNNNIKSNDYIYVEIPKFKLMHIRTKRFDRDFVIIYKNNNDSKSHYEFIKGDDMSSGLFKSNDIKEKLFGLIKYSSQNYIWEYENNNFSLREDPYSRINWESYIEDRFELISQHIDDYGKMRYINCHVKDDKNIKFTINIPPSQPINIRSTNKIYYPTKNNVIKYFGEPTNEDDNKLYYPVLDYKNKVFIYYGDKEQDLGIADLALEKSDQINNRNLDLFMQLINWLWRISGNKFKEWYKKWVIKDDTVDKNSMAPSKLIKRKLPDLNNTKDGLKAIVGWWPEFFKEDKIHLFSELYRKVKVQFLEIEYKTLDFNNDHPLVKPSLYLNGIYKWEIDFPKSDDSFIFVNVSNFTEWFKTVNSSNYENFTQDLYEELDINNNINLLFRSQPYIYRDKITGIAYIIQNVIYDNKNIERAFNVCINWVKNVENLRFNAEPITEDIDKYYYAIYVINTNKQIEALETIDIKTKDKHFLQLLCYNPSVDNPRYAALLPLSTVYG